MTGQTPAPRSSTRGARRLGQLLLLMVSLTLTLLLLELALVLVGFRYVPLDIEVVQITDTRASHVFENRNFEYDPKLIWRPRPSHSVFNSQGFRGPVLPAIKEPGSFRIFAVGDSNTLGWAGPDGANWPRDLGKLVGPLRSRSVVVNAGVWGYASYQGLLRFRETLAFEPDLVLVSFGSNDAHRVLQSDREYAARPSLARTAGWILSRFRLGQMVLSASDALSAKNVSQVQARVGLDEYRGNLTAIIHEARERDVEVVLLTRPYVGEISSPNWWKNWGPEYNAATVEIAERLGVTVVDLYSFFKGMEKFFADESHFTGDGHERAAAIIFDHIKPLVLSETQNRP